MVRIGRKVEQLPEDRIDLYGEHARTQGTNMVVILIKRQVFDRRYTDSTPSAETTRAHFPERQTERYTQPETGLAALPRNNVTAKAVTTPLWHEDHILLMSRPNFRGYGS